MWKKYRTALELLQAIIVTGLPFVTVNGESALRFDIPTLKLHLFGSVIWMREFYLVLAAALFFLLLIGFVTIILGRVWCGWLCPQTVLLDFGEGLATLFGKKLARKVEKLLPILLSALVSLTMIWYFIPPAETFRALFVSPTITTFFLVLWAVVSLELAFLGRKFCMSICPYAMLQNLFFDKDTLIIEYDVSRERDCMKCDACVKVCPVGIDIKQGLSTACIACAECIDACVEKTARKHIPPFPNYKGKILRPKTFWLGGAAAVAASTLLVLIWSRPAVDFLVTRDNATLPSGLNRYSYSIHNNSGEERMLELSSPDNVTLLGEHTLRLKPFSAIHGRILVKANSKLEHLHLTISGRSISINREAGFL